MPGARRLRRCGCTHARSSRRRQCLSAACGLWHGHGRGHAIYAFYFRQTPFTQKLTPLATCTYCTATDSRHSSEARGCGCRRAALGVSRLPEARDHP